MSYFNQKRINSSRNIISYEHYLFSYISRDMVKSDKLCGILNVFPLIINHPEKKRNHDVAY
jgi:hypothetical protein